MGRRISYKPPSNQGPSLRPPGFVRQPSNAAPAPARPAEPLSGTASVAQPFGRSSAAASRSAARSARARVRIWLRRQRASFKRPAARSRLAATHRRRGGCGAGRRAAVAVLLRCSGGAAGQYGCFCVRPTSGSTEPLTASVELYRLKESARDLPAAETRVRKYHPRSARVTRLPRSGYLRLYALSGTSRDCYSVSQIGTRGSSDCEASKKSSGRGPQPSQAHERPKQPKQVCMYPLQPWGPGHTGHARTFAYTKVMHGM